MDRREALMGLLVAGTSGISEQKTKETAKRFLICINLYVGNLSPEKANKFVENTIEKLKLEKPNHLNFVILPQRDYPTSIEVYSLNGASWVGSPDKE